MTRLYLASYPYKGKRYAIDICAESEAEARERIKALAWTKYDGELVARVPVAPRWFEWLTSKLVAMVAR